MFFLRKKKHQHPCLPPKRKKDDGTISFVGRDDLLLVSKVGRDDPLPPIGKGRDGHPPVKASPLTSGPFLSKQVAKQV